MSDTPSVEEVVCRATIQLPPPVLNAHTCGLPKSHGTHGTRHCCCTPTHPDRKTQEVLSALHPDCGFEWDEGQTGEEFVDEQTRKSFKEVSDVAAAVE